MKLLKKLAVAQLSNLSVSQLAALVPNSEAGAVFVGRIAGSARSYETVQTTFGESLKFKGEFRGWDMAGEMAASVVAYLPAPVDEMLRDAIENARQNAGEGAKSAPVDFAFDILIVHDPKEGSKGYQYRVRTLTESAVSDPVAALLGSLPKLELSEPKKAEADNGKK